MSALFGLNILNTFLKIQMTFNDLFSIYLGSY